MKKQFILYILFVACLLSACSTDYDEPDSVTPGDREILSLTVSASDIVVSDGLSSRSVEVGNTTIFDTGDMVGLIVLDKAGNLLVNNVPYRYDGSNWNFAGDVDKQPYYDTTMSTYIVYYPYKKEVNGCKSVEEIKSKDVFAPLKNQTTEEKYRQADILVYTYKGEATKKIKAEMMHVYDSFTFRIFIKWKLDPINEEIAYQPMQETLKKFTIVYIPDDSTKDSIVLFDNDDANKNLIYRDEDGFYRYLLTAGQEATIKWQYTYRNINFHGKRKINAKTSGTRYVHDEKADMGKLPGPNMEISDFYCIRGSKGYVLPWDAADRINEMSEEKEECFVGRHCIGLVMGAGQHDNDISDYTDSKIKEKKCNGYVMALTEDAGQLEWAKSGSNMKLVGTYFHHVPDRAIYDWNGYYNLQKMDEYISNPTNGTSWENFPAANACINYGYNCGLSAPDNTTGWFLPSAGMIDFVWKSQKEVETAWRSYKMADLLAERFATIKKYIEQGKDPVYQDGHYTYIENIKGFDTNWSYWTSNEVNANTSGTNAYIINIEKCITNPKRNTTSSLPTRPITVRAFLAF